MLWIYKCNARGHEHQRAIGDWTDFFALGRPAQWGSTSWVPQLSKAQPGDTIIAYQTDRNELVGVTQVKSWRRKSGKDYLILEPLEAVGVKVRPLKRRYRSLAKIPALQPGPIRTLYPISPSDARELLRRARASLQIDVRAVEEEGERALRGAGFGTPLKNKAVEEAAIRHVTRRLRSLRWSVTDVSKENRGYDLFCRRGDKRLEVEVKGARGEGLRFILTERERKFWIRSSTARLAYVANALSESPAIGFVLGKHAARDFLFTPLAYVLTRQPNKRLKLASAPE